MGGGGGATRASSGGISKRGTFMHLWSGLRYTIAQCAWNGLRLRLVSMDLYFQFSCFVGPVVCIELMAK